MDQDILLRARDLQSGYGDVQVLWGVSIDVRSGSIVAIVGANGAGKTTLLMTLSGAVRPKAGSIEFCGKDITGDLPHVSVSAGMAYVPEGRRLFKTLNVRDNLLLGAYNRTKSAEIHEDLDRVFSLFPILRERQSQDASTLSGGEQQMCAIAAEASNHRRIISGARANGYRDSRGQPCRDSCARRFDTARGAGRRDCVRGVGLRLCDRYGARIHARAIPGAAVAVGRSTCLSRFDVSLAGSMQIMGTE